MQNLVQWFFNMQKACLQHTQITNVLIAFEKRTYKYSEIDILPPFKLRIDLYQASISDLPKVLLP